VLNAKHFASVSEYKIDVVYCVQQYKCIIVVIVISEDACDHCMVYSCTQWSVPNANVCRICYLCFHSLILWPLTWKTWNVREFKSGHWSGKSQGKRNSQG